MKTIQSGDQVWVRTGVDEASSSHEESAIVLDILTEPTEDELLVKYSVSGHRAVVSTTRVRPMERASTRDTNNDPSGRTVRRSARTLTTALDSSNTTKESVRVTPSPTEIGSEAGSSKKRRSRASSKEEKAKSRKVDREVRRKAKTVKPAESPYFSRTNDDDDDGVEDSNDDEALALLARRNKKKKSLRFDKITSGIPLEIDKADSGSNSSKAKSNRINGRGSDSAEDDGEDPGGLNQPSPFNVEYSKSSRATCRTCDEIIRKGEVRVGHIPLFRGKPGYMVFRHLQCTAFSEHVECAQDVINYDLLEDDDYERLVEQVEISKAKIREEMEELEPDELVQKSFEGEIRLEPPGLTATLLPFQVEGFSWMHHQEVKSTDVRGGILADEMGMGKTIQTIAAILDNRPLLQHCKPGVKHPSDDLKQREEEEKLWGKASDDWQYEMDILKVMKKIRSRDRGGRAGTLVVCPVIALTQWKTEIEKFTDGTLKVCTYHGPDRESQTPREMLKKYDVVLTTYQVVEADFRKMTSPNRVTCPNCGGRFKIDKLPIHLKYFCGETAQKTEAQARQRRNSDRERQASVGRIGRRPFRGSLGKDGKKSDRSELKSQSERVVASMKRDSEAASDKVVARPKHTPSPKGTSTPVTPGRSASKRSAAHKAASLITKSASEWMPAGDDSGSDAYRSNSASSSDEDSDDNDGMATQRRNRNVELSESSVSDSDDSVLKRAVNKQRMALEKVRQQKGNKKQPIANGVKKKCVDKGKKKFESNDDDSSRGEESNIGGDGAGNDIDMDALVVEAMEGAKNSVLHSLCWWRIILDEAHFIKTRSSQTANAAFSLVGIHRWCLSGTPLQNRVGEFYSLVRFLRLDPMAYYYCRAKGCDCKNMHYRIVGGVCEDCGHGGVQHFSHFNKYVLNPIQREGYSGDGRRAMFTLKNEVLDKCLLRRTKETKAADMELPPRLVQIKPIRLHPIEEDFYSALYTQTKSSFNDYVDSGTLLNNYAHIFDLLIRMRQSVDHPYLVIYSNKNTNNGRTNPTGGTLTIANGSADCDLCHEPPTERVVSTCCGAAYCRTCVLEYMSGTTGLAASGTLSCPSCRGAFSIDLETRADLEDDSALNIAPGSVSTKEDGSDCYMPSLKDLPHVATGSILRRINLADFATSSKIEALTQELVAMRQKSPGSKAIVFSQFVNMLDLIRWRLHSDPYLEDIGLGARALHGGMNVKARDSCLKEFREDNNVRVLLMSLKAGGVALNLTQANYIFLMDPWWNPAAEMQAIDRTHRLGQYRPIRAIRFIAENTVEERILQLQEKKRLVFDGTVGRDAGSLKMLTVDDMKSLFA